jgi:signal transduction histidine kinase
VIVLIPCAALLVTGVTVAGYLISEGQTARATASFFSHSSGSLIQTASAIEQERTLSLEALGGDRQAQAALPGQWKATNGAFSRLNTMTKGVSIPTANTNALQGLIGKLSAVRRSVQKGTASPSSVDAFYTQFTSGSSSALTSGSLAGISPAAAVDEVTAEDLYAVPDLHSRVAGLGAGWAARGVVAQPDRARLAQLAGAYRNQLQSLLPRLPGSVQAAYARLAAGNAWLTATSGEDDLAQSGKLAMPASSWLAAENAVSKGLLGLSAADSHYAEAAASTSASQTLNRSLLLGALVLVLAAAAFTAALILANRLVRRLRRLRSETLTLADVTLPSMVRRIGDGEQVNVGAEVAMSGYGADEIGQVATAFNTAQQTAVTAAAAEARMRAGISKVFLDIAHRSQLVVHRQLELLDVAEAKQGDPEHLELLFQLDHLATRARRNAENLLILGGGQPGRKWRRPAGLEDIVRSAVSETEHFARVSTVRLPSVQVQGSVVGDLIHLLAELVDNATAFSPPGAAVNLHGNLVGKGVVVQVEDQGLGIEFEERERLNETLRNAPGFQAMALSGQRHLGLFVVGQLAQRHGITVSLQESPYGGITAIVLVPSSAIVPDGAADGDMRPAQGPGWNEPPWQTASGPVPRPRGTGGPDLRGPAAAESLVPSAAQAGSPAAGPPAATWPEPHPHPGHGRAPLPRRERLANLAPGLRPDTQDAGSAAPRRTRSPEQARGSMSAFQHGTRLGRAAQGPVSTNTNGGGQ